MRRMLCALLVGVSLIAAGCGSDDDDAATTATTVADKAPQFAAGSTMAKIQAKGKIVIGTKFNQLGSGLKNPATGELEGFDIEIGKLIAAELFGVEASKAEDKIEFVETPTPVREFTIQKGDVDIIVATYTINDARKAFVDFAGPYVIDGQTVMVPADNTTIKTLEDLNGKKVCTARASTTPKNLTDKKITANITLFETYPECATALRQGRVDAVVTDRGILLGLVEQSARGFKIVDIDVSEEPLGIGLKKGDDAFRDFLNDTLEEIFENGEWATAYAGTLGKLGLETPEPPTVNRYTGSGPATSVATTGVVPVTTTTAASGGSRGPTTSTTSSVASTTR
ncbi:MAG TPA: glutamate ABC transporter substrate-binding protein [Acidimicrobiales bacterium]|nr:glutamate ABC transporter substrate-binding protein [Acidimicrobiales bacterium]